MKRMIKIICSRCNNEIPHKEGYYLQIHKRKDLTREQGFLCNECIKNFQKLMKGGLNDRRN